jgi:hypothetical protein
MANMHDYVTHALQRSEYVLGPEGRLHEMCNGKRSIGCEYVPHTGPQNGDNHHASYFNFSALLANSSFSFPTEAAATRNLSRFRNKDRTTTKAAPATTMLKTP